MKKILCLLVMLLSLQVYAGTASMDAQEKKPVNNVIIAYLLIL